MAPIQINFQPTLFVFVGTSSVQIGWRLRQLLRQAYGDIPVLRFLWVDIDASIDPRAAPYFDDESRAVLTGVNYGAVVKNLDNFPTIKAWWPDISTFKPGALVGGGAPQQMRLAGRMAFFRMFAEDNVSSMSLYDKLKAAAASLTQISSIDRTVGMSNTRFQYSVSEGCRAVIVFSPCGGTGSSMAFDLAYLCRQMLGNQNPTIVSVSILPSVVDQAMKSGANAQKEKIRANAYAWFKEDNFLTENPYWDVQYPKIGRVRQPAPPFDYRYLVDLTNTGGYSLGSAEEVYTMIAQALFIDTGSALSGSLRGFTANVSSLGEVFQGKRQIYSTLSAASLIFPKQRLLNYCTSRLGQDLLQNGLLGEPDSQLVGVQASTLLSQAGLRDDSLIADLVGKAELRLDLEQSILRAESVAEALARIDAQENLNSQARIWNQERIAKYARDRLAHLKASLDQEIARIASIKGYAFARAVVECLLSAGGAALEDQSMVSLADFKRRIVQEGVTRTHLEETRSAFKRARSVVYNLDNGPEDTLERMVNLKGWKEKFKTGKVSAVNAMRKTSEMEAQLAAQDQVLQIYDQIAALAGEISARLAGIIQRTQMLAGDLEAAWHGFASPSQDESMRYEFQKEVQIDFDQYYRRQAALINPAEVFTGMLSNREARSLDAISDWTENGLREAALNFAGKFFIEDLDETSLLKTIESEAAKQGLDPREVTRGYIDQLVKYCQPFCQYDQNMGLDSVEGISMIGVEDENNPLLPDFYRTNPRFEIKTTGFRDRMDVVRLHHGLPAFLLAGMETCKDIYEKKRRETDPLHVLPGMSLAQDLIPDRDRVGREMFAVALAMQYIVQSTTYFYFDPRREQLNYNTRPRAEYRIAQGRSNAEEAFARRQDWVAVAQANIEAEITRIGNDAAIRRLDEVIAELRANTRSTKDEDSRRQYENEIDALENFQRRLGKAI